jgi:hypothetical protein
LYRGSIGYTADVARGWESKSVEDQINERKAEAEASGTKKLSREEIEKRSRRDSILLARSRTLAALESTVDERYRALLQRTLEHLDSELAKLE